MFLTRVRVAPEGLTPSTMYQLLRGEAYGNHQLLWQLFPDAEQRPFLFRQEFASDATHDDGHPQGLPLFYMLSSVAPQPVPRLLSCETKPFHPVLRTGQRLAFRLRANPVIARRDEGRKNSRNHDVLMDAKAAARAEGITDAQEIQQRMDAAGYQWLADETRAEHAGYRLVTAPEMTRYQQHYHRRKGRAIRFSSLDYEGILQVTDPDRFWRTLIQGIGRSRAFGCGLMLIRPA